MESCVGGLFKLMYDSSGLHTQSKQDALSTGQVLGHHQRPQSDEHTELTQLVNMVSELRHQLTYITNDRNALAKKANMYKEEVKILESEVINGLKMVHRVHEAAANKEEEVNELRQLLNDKDEQYNMLQETLKAKKDEIKGLVASGEGYCEEVELVQCKHPELSQAQLMELEQTKSELVQTKSNLLQSKQLEGMHRDDLERMAAEMESSAALALEARVTEISTSHAAALNDLRAQLEKASAKEIERVRCEAEKEQTDEIDRVRNEMERAHAAELEALRAKLELSSAEETESSTLEESTKLEQSSVGETEPSTLEESATQIKGASLISGVVDCSAGLLQIEASGHSCKESDGTSAISFSTEDNSSVEEDSLDEASFYIGDEEGFLNSESVGDSDISETASEGEDDYDDEDDFESVGDSDISESASEEDDDDVEDDFESVSGSDISETANDNEDDDKDDCSEESSDEEKWFDASSVVIDTSQ